MVTPATITVETQRGDTCIQLNYGKTVAWKGGMVASWRSGAVT